MKKYLVEGLPFVTGKSITDIDRTEKTGKQIIMCEGDKWEVDENRLKVLLEDNVFKTPLVRIVEEIKEEKKKIEKEVAQVKTKKETATIKTKKKTK